MTKRLVEALGGSISVKSKEGKGTSFTVVLPNRTVTEVNEEKPMVSLMNNRLVEVANVEFSDIYF